MNLIIVLIVAALGLIIGSFLNVCIYRIPLSRLDRWYSPEEGEEAQEVLSHLRKDLTIMYPARSFCPKCEHQLAWHENVPLFSWLMLRGKCSSCASPISSRYPLIEILTAIFALLSVYKFGLSPTALLIFLVVCVFIIITFIDYDYYVIPDELSLRVSIVALLIVIFNHFLPTFGPPVAWSIADSIGGILAGAGFLFIVYWLYYLVRRREGLGLGDIKLLLFIGALLGVTGVLYTIFIGSLLGSVVGVLLILFGGRKMSSAIPFGPYLTSAATLYIFTGDAPLAWLSQLTQHPGL